MGYNSVTDTIVGDKLMVFVKIDGELTPIAFGTNCTIDLSADTVDASNKMSAVWKEYVPGQLGWTVSSESLLSTVSGHVSFAKLKSLMAAREPVEIAISNVVKVDGEITEGPGFVRGKAFITSLNATAQNGSIVTSSCNLQGTGELEDATVVPEDDDEPIGT